MRKLTVFFMAFLALFFLGCSNNQKDVEYEKDTTEISPGQQSGEPDAKWYQKAVFYHIWVRAFSDGVYDDGIGDLRGIINKLDYLNDGNPDTDSDLGVTAIWLSPIFECSYKESNMHGYDTTDYYSINNRFGKKADLAELLNAAHARGMRVIFDFVPNHTSNSHPWVTENINLYKHAATNLGWPSAWNSSDSSNSVWFWSGTSYVYSAFQTSSLFDLDYDNTEVVSRMQNVLTYWLDRGFDGARMDAVRYIVENGSGQQADQDETHTILKGFRTVIDAYASSRKMMVAEAWTGADAIKNYYGSGTDEFNMCFDFPGAYDIKNALSESDASDYENHFTYLKSNYPSGYVSATFTANHDNVVSRAATLYGSNKQKCVASAALNILSFGTPFIYYGEEIGMTGASGDDINLRANMDWSSVGSQSADSQSLLSWNRYLVRARLGNTALREGGYTVCAKSNNNVVAFVKDWGDQYVLVAVNVSPSVQSLTVSSLPVASSTAVNILGANPDTSVSGSSLDINSLPAYGVRVILLQAGTPDQDVKTGIFTSDLN